MLHRIITRIRTRVYTVTFIAVLTLVSLGTALYTGFATDAALILLYKLPLDGHSAAPIYFGPESLEERILNSKVVARVKLLSMSYGIEPLSHRIRNENGEWVHGDTSYINTREFHFEVLEYLKGSGGSKLIGIADGDLLTQTRLGALMLGNEEGFFEEHDTIWDKNEAIVFLREMEFMPSTLNSDRYRLGKGYAGYLIGGEGDGYTVDSPHRKAWLPAVDDIDVRGTDMAVASRVVGEQRFLTGAEGAVLGSSEDRIGYQVAKSAFNSALGTGGGSSTITLSQIKALIAKLDAEVAAGDGSDEYFECVYRKYRWEREFTYRRENSSKERQIQTNHELASGLPATTAFGWGDISDPHPDLLRIDPNLTPTWEAWLDGEDADMFQVEQMSIIAITRPLPRGEYTYYYNSRAARYILCDAYPEARRTWNIHTVRVSATDDVLHEAFFDPVDADDGSVGAGDGNGGVLKPDTFDMEGGTKTTIRRIAWSKRQVVMALSPVTDLNDHHIDFIALDASVALRLDFDDAVKIEEDDATVLAWGVCEQPWQDGDLLMIRISESGADLTEPTPANDAECAPEEQISMPIE